MKKALFILTIIFMSNAASAMTLQEQIAADSVRDPYAEAPSIADVIEIEEVITIEGYIEPKAAEQMKPSKIFKLDHGNTVVEQ